MALAHQCLNAVVAAVHEDAVCDADIALHIEVQSVFVAARIADQRYAGAGVGLHETAGEDTFVRSAGALVIDIGDAVAVVLAEVEHESVHHNIADRAAIAVGPAGVEVEQRCDERFAGGLELGYVGDDIALAEVGGVSSVEADELAGFVGGIAETAYFVVAASHSSEIIAFRDKYNVAFFSSVDGLLQILHSSRGRKTVGTAGTGAYAHIECPALGCRSR